MKLFVRQLVGSFVVVASVVSCGGSGDGGTAGFDRSSCEKQAAGELGADGAICADTGLRPVTDGFSFENWGGPVAEDAVTVETAITVFGRDAVCARGDDETCVPLPAVLHWIDATNLQMQGGRCEGMAVLSQRLLDGDESHVALQPGASVTADLERPTLSVAASISRWWISQGFESVLEATQRAAQLEPSEIAAELVDAIAQDAGATIGIYANGMGHAITPIAVTRMDDGNFEILNYDNNFPGEVTVLTIDAESETWSYDVGAANAGTDSGVWSGGKGSIDFALMADREGEQKVPWSESDRSTASKGSARVTITTGGASIAGLVVSVGDTIIDSRDLSTVSNGIKVYPNRGGIGTGAMVEIPAGLSNVKVKPVIGEILDPTATSVDLVLAVDAPGQGSQIVTDELLLEELTDSEYGDFILELSTDDGYAAEFDVADDGEIELGVAYDEESLEAIVEDGQDVELFDSEDQDDFTVDLTDADGSVLFDASFDGTADDEEISTIDIDIDEATGTAVVEEVPLDSELIDFPVDDGASPSSDTIDETETTIDGGTESGVDDTNSTDGEQGPDSIIDPTPTTFDEPQTTDAPVDSVADENGGGDQGEG